MKRKQKATKGWAMSDHHVLLVIVVVKVVVSTTDVLAKWKEKGVYESALSRLAESMDDLKDHTERAKKELGDELFSLCREVSGPQPAHCRFHLPGLARGLRALGEGEVIHRQSLQTELPALRANVRLLQIHLLMEAWNAASRLALLAAVGLRRLRLRLRRFSAVAAALAFANPLARHLCGWAAARWMRGDAERQYLRVMFDRWLGTQFGSLWTDSPATWPFMLALMYPVGDHHADFSTWHRVVGSDETGVGIGFFALHVYYYILLKAFLKDVNNDSKENEREAIAIKKIPGLKQFPKLEEAFLHSCIYGHVGRARSLLRRRPDVLLFPLSTATPNCLHLALARGDARLARTILRTASASDEWLDALVGARSPEERGLNCAEVAAASGHADLARCFFAGRRRRKRTRRHCRPERAVEIAIGRDHFVLATEMTRWFNFDNADALDLLRRCIGLQQQQSCLSEEDQGLKLLLSSYKERLLKMFRPEGSRQEEEVDMKERDSGLASMLADLLECPVCMEDMSVGEPVRIFACSNDHWLCSGCATHERVSLCPICREDFRDNPPRRCLTTEKIACGFARAKKVGR